MSQRRLFRTTLALLALPVAAGLVVVEVQNAWGACSISWSGQMTSVQANVAGSFGLLTVPLPDLTTDTTTQGQSTWTLHMAFTPGNSPGMQSGAVETPTTESITSNGQQVTRTLSGVLTNHCESGTYEFSAWDGTFFNCADAYQFDVIASTEDCDD